MPQARLSKPEFIAMMAIMMAVTAFSTDAMLPAFPAIASELTPHAPERTSLMVALFMLGMGAGTFFTGPLSDAIGRKPVIIGGFFIYGIGSVVSWWAQDFTLILLGRVLQGLGAAGSRVVAPAMIRDLHSGREMAQITSFIMTVFMIVPAMAPMIGSIVIDAFGWRSIFLCFVTMATIASLWLGLRQAETLAVERRRKMTLKLLGSGVREVLSHKTVVGYTVVMTLGFSMILTMISSIQPIYSHFGVVETFPRWFMAGALISATGTLINAWAVMRFGMRKLAFWAFVVQGVLGLIYALALVIYDIPLSYGVYFFFVWAAQLFFMNGLTFGNLNALALQPLGHMAGLGASVITALSTIGSALIAGVLALYASENHLVLVVQCVLCAAASAVLMHTIDSKNRTA